MRYNKNAKIRLLSRKGVLMRPRYAGLMVLVDHLAPKMAMRFREFKEDCSSDFDALHAAWQYETKKRGIRLWDDATKDAYDKLEAEFKPRYAAMRREHLAAFAVLCKDAYAWGRGK